MVTMEMSVRCVCTLLLQPSTRTPQQHAGSPLRYPARGAFRSMAGRLSCSVEAAVEGRHRQPHYLGSWKPERGGRFVNSNRLPRNARFGAAAAAPASNVLHRRGGSGVFNPCRAKNKWFGGHQEPEEEALQDASVQVCCLVLSRLEDEGVSE